MQYIPTKLCPWQGLALLDSPEQYFLSMFSPKDGDRASLWNVVDV